MPQGSPCHNDRYTKPKSYQIQNRLPCLFSSVSPDRKSVSWLHSRTATQKVEIDAGSFIKWLLLDPIATKTRHHSFTWGKNLTLFWREKLCWQPAPCRAPGESKQGGPSSSVNFFQWPVRGTCLRTSKLLGHVKASSSTRKLPCPRHAVHLHATVAVDGHEDDLFTSHPSVTFRLQGPPFILETHPRTFAKVSESQAFARICESQPARRTKPWLCRATLLGKCVFTFKDASHEWQ